MPTKDLEGSVAAICRLDPRFRRDAYRFVLDALDHTLRHRSATAAAEIGVHVAEDPSVDTDLSVSEVPVSNVTGRQLLEGFRDLAVDRFGALAPEVLRWWGFTRTDDVGAVVFNMVNGGLLQKTASDSPADYHAIFEFETAFDRAFRARLAAQPVRIRDPRSA